MIQKQNTFSARLKTLWQLLNTDLGASKKEGSIRIQPEELEQFVLMSGKGLEPEQCIRLCFHNHQAMLEKLESGMDLAALFSAGCNEKLLGTLMRCLDFEKALQIRTILRKCSRQLLESLVKDALYPLFLLAAATALTLFFSLQILPAMSGLTDPSSERLIALIFVLFAILWLLIFCFGVGFVWMLSGRKAPVWIEKQTLARKIVSIQTACLLAALLEQNLSTRQIIELLETLPEVPLVQSRAKRWKKKLSRGISLMACLSADPGIDPVMLRFLQAGMECGKPWSVLESYQASAMPVLNRHLKKISLALQCASYGGIGLLVLSMVQVMMAPLNMLQTF